MIRYVIRRIVAMVPLVLIVTAFVFIHQVLHPLPTSTDFQWVFILPQLFQASKQLAG